MSELSINLHDMRVIVTGAAGDIGRSICELIRKAGGQAIGWDQIAGKDIDQVDVTNRGLVDAALERAFRDGPVLGLVNAAGIGGQIPFLEIDEADWRHMLDINLTGSFNVLQLWARRVTTLRSAGSAVNIASVTARVALRDNVHYTASKGGVDALTRGAAVALAEHSVRVNAIAPGPIPTNLNRSRWENNEAGQNELLQRIALGRLGTPGEIASTVVFLLSPLSAWTTGETVYVDGGMTVSR